MYFLKKWIYFPIFIIYTIYTNKKNCISLSPFRKLCYTDVVTKVSETNSVNAGNSENEGKAVTNVAKGFLAAMGGEVILWI